MEPICRGIARIRLMDEDTIGRRRGLRPRPQRQQPRRYHNALDAPTLGLEAASTLARQYEFGRRIPDEYERMDRQLERKEAMEAPHVSASDAIVSFGRGELGHSSLLWANGEPRNVCRPPRRPP
ncbi:unnamed protein product [Scytosiphon promiscuus]